MNAFSQDCRGAAVMRNMQPTLCTGWLVVVSLFLLLTGCGEKTNHSGESADKAGQQETGKGHAGGGHAGESKDADHEKGVLTLSPEELQRAGVKVEPLRPQQVTATITVTATIRPNQDRVAQIAPRVEGRIANVSATLGDQVRSGQTLATLDSMVLGEAASTLQQAQSSYRVAQADLKRAESLAADEIIPQKELLRARAESEKAAAAVRAAEDRLRLLGASATAPRVPSVIPLVAPFAGTVIQKKAVVGQLANPSDALFIVADLSKVWIEANLPEAMLGHVQPRASAVINVTAYPNARFTGKITYIGNMLDKDTRTIPARIEVDNRDGRLKLDMFATVHIETAGTSANAGEVLTVPDEAVMLMQGQPTVFVQEPRGFQAHPIDAGEKLGGRTVVKSGLQAGDQVVTAGAYALKARLLKSQIGDSH